MSRGKVGRRRAKEEREKQWKEEQRGRRPTKCSSSLAAIAPLSSLAPSLLPIVAVHESSRARGEVDRGHARKKEREQGQEGSSAGGKKKRKRNSTKKRLVASPLSCASFTAGGRRQCTKLAIAVLLEDGERDRERSRGLQSSVDTHLWGKREND